VNRDAALEVITLRELPQLFTQRRIRRKDQTNYYLQLVILFARGFVQTQVEAQALNLGANFQIIKLTYSATGGRVTFFNAAYI
jgi:hypothetical protein